MAHVRILAVDVGTGTQDILAFDSAETLENCPKLVVPSPTLALAKRIRQATIARHPILLTGVTMGGGPCHWAAEDHLRQGLAVYATPDAARTFDDDLDRVAAMGIRIVGEDEAKRFGALDRNLERFELRDFDFDAIVGALARFGVPTNFDACAVAVFDHGHAPPNVSDRRFRFEHIAAQVATINAQRYLAAFGYRRDELPARLTRMRAVAATAPNDLDLVLMDTGPAAVVGALDDPNVRAHRSLLVANVGNFHTLAFHLTLDDQGCRVSGMFEHHTGFMDRAKLEDHLVRLGSGTLDNDEVFADMGHGALIVAGEREPPRFVAVTGPRRGMLQGSKLAPYFAVPHGDMMLAGCFGLLRAYAHKRPEHAHEIAAALAPSGTQRAPWEAL